MTRPRASPLRDELEALLRLAAPLALAQAGQAVMGLVDTAVLGRVSEVAQGAAGVGNGLCMAFNVIGLGVMLAFDPLVAQAIGAGQPARARTLFWQAIWMAVFCGVLLALPLWLSPLLLGPLGVDAEVARGAATYVSWRTPQLMGLLLFVAARTWLQSTGRTTAILIAMGLANLANLGLDVVLVFGVGPIPALGIAGSSIATTVCTWLQLLVLARAAGPAPAGASRKLDLALVRQAFRLGAPIALQLLAEVGVFVLAGILAGGLGPAAVAAHQIAATWSSFSFCFAVGIGSAAATRVGWAVGAGDVRGARRTGLVAFGASSAWMTGPALLFLLAPRALARAMTPDLAVIDLTIALLGVAAVFQISDGLQAVGSGSLRGSGDTRYPFVANLLGHWLVGLPVALYLGLVRGLGIIGVWWGLSAGLTAVAIALVIRFLAVTRHAVDGLTPDAGVARLPGEVMI